MIDAANPVNSFALDPSAIGGLKLAAKTDPDSALKSAAQQFESVFMQMLLKSMRDSVDQDGPFDSEETRQYTSMLDQQLSQTLSGKGLGLAQIMVNQLKPHSSTHSSMSTAAPDATASPGNPAQKSDSMNSPGGRASPRSAAAGFVNKLWPHAVEASRSTGIAPNLMIGHAALESGWGKSEIRGPNGEPSYNLFGIKAGRNWKGPVVSATTTEYVNGVAQKSVANFRSYASYEEAFKDYARLLKGSSRYAAVVNGGNDSARFAAGLQQAGYATDPMYAEKLNRIFQGSALRQGLLG